MRRSLEAFKIHYNDIPSASFESGRARSSKTMMERRSFLKKASIVATGDISHRLTAAAAGVCDIRTTGKAATYTRTGTAVTFIISELPGERAEALFIAMAALGAHGGRAIHK